MEAATARERENLLRYRSAGRTYLSLGGFQVLGVDHDKSSSRHRCVCGESTAQAAVMEAGVIGTVIREAPAENFGIEAFRGGDVGRGELDVVDTVVVAHCIVKCLVGCQSSSPIGCPGGGSAGRGMTISFGFISKRRICAALN